MKTTQEQLEEVQEAITAILTAGQDVSKGDKRVMMANLNALHAREQVLLRRYRSETGTGGAAINTCIVKRGV
jgi:hypothetical protein